MTNIRQKLAAKKSKLHSPGPKLDDHPAKLHDYKNGDFYNVDIDLILPDSNQPRKFFNPDSLKELSVSIKQQGVLQPIIIRKGEDNKIYLVAGERRLRASKMSGLMKIPAVFTTGRPSEIALIENLQRENLNPIEEAEALERMIKKYNYTQEQLSLIIGKARSTITETLSLNKLPDIIKNACRRADIPKRLLIEVSKQSDSKTMLSLFKQAKTLNLTSTQVREITRKPHKGTLKTPIISILDKTHNLLNFLNKFNFQTIKNSEKTEIINELQKLKDCINKIVTGK